MSDVWFHKAQQRIKFATQITKTESFFPDGSLHDLTVSFFSLKYGSFRDLFWRLKKRHPGKVSVSCPDVMFQINTHDRSDEDLVAFANKHVIHRIVEPCGQVRWYGCRLGRSYTSGWACPKKKGLALSPSDMENLADAVKFIMRECENAGIYCEMQDGTLLGEIYSYFCEYIFFCVYMMVEMKGKVARDAESILFGTSCEGHYECNALFSGFTPHPYTCISPFFLAEFPVPPLLALPPHFQIEFNLSTHSTWPTYSLQYMGCVFTLHKLIVFPPCDCSCVITFLKSESVHFGRYYNPAVSTLGFSQKVFVFTRKRFLFKLKTLFPSLHLY